MTVVERDAQRPWVKRYPSDVPNVIPYPTVSIGDLLDDVAGRYPDADAVVFEGHTLSWRDVQAAARRLSSTLRTLEVGKGDRVVLLLPNVPHFVVAYYAVLKLGAVVVAANPLFTDRDLETYIGTTEARVIITLDVLYEKVAASWKNAGVRYVVVGSGLDFMPSHLRIAGRLAARLTACARDPSRAHSLAGHALASATSTLEQLSPELRRLSEAPRPREPIPFGSEVISFREAIAVRLARDAGTQVTPGDPAVLIYTTGTTGTPKAAVLSHANLIANAYQMRCWFPQLKEGTETILAVLPFFHAYGLTLALNAGLVLAARSVLIPRLVLKDIFEAIQRYRPTALPGVPALFVSIVNGDRGQDYDLRSIRVCVSGGAPLPLEIKDRFDAITGSHLYEGYGLTEASPLTHAQPYDQTAPAGSIGVPVADTDAMIVDDDGHEAPAGETGELIVRGPQVMTGYWRDAEDTAMVLKNGWLHTGDIARMDSDGYFFILDRKKELIITGGENIAPREIEEALYRHPKIEEAAVAGVPQGVGGEIVKAYIVLRDGETATGAEIKRWLGTEVAHYKVPREIEFRSDLPKSPMGKIAKRALVEEERERHRTAHGPGRRQSNDSGGSGPVGKA